MISSSSNEIASCSGNIKTEKSMLQYVSISIGLCLKNLKQKIKLLICTNKYVLIYKIHFSLKKVNMVGIKNINNLFGLYCFKKY